MTVSKNKMRVIAIDYGDARTGVAVSDETASIAGEAWVLREKDQGEVARTIASEAANRGASHIVVGYPKNMNGTVGFRAEKSEQLAEKLKKISDAEIVLWDERMTTMSAHRILSDSGKFGKKRKKAVDAVAATLILEGYLGYLSRK